MIFKVEKLISVKCQIRRIKHTEQKIELTRPFVFKHVIFIQPAIDQIKMPMRTHTFSNRCQFVHLRVRCHAQKIINLIIKLIDTVLSRRSTQISNFLWKMG